MTDSEYKRQKKRVEVYLDKWYKPTGFGWWTTDVSFSRHVDNDLPNAIAVTDCLWEYRKAHIEFFLPVIAEIDDDKLEENVVHELSHILTWPLWYQVDRSSDQMRQIGEYTAEAVKNALMFARIAGGKDK